MYVRGMAETVLHALRRGADAGASLRVAGAEDLPLAALLEPIEARARGLVAAGLQPRERVGVALPNGLDCLLWVYAVIAAGGATVFVPPSGKPAEMRAYARRAQARWVIGPLSEDGFLTAGEARQAFADDAGAELPEPGLDWEAGCFTTSGSTGTPKLAALTHGAWAANVEVIRAVTEDGIDGTSLYVLPLCHVALLPNVHAFLVGGGRVVQQTVFDAPAAMRLAGEEAATYMTGSPAIYGLILQRCSLPDPALRFRRVTYGAAAMPSHWAAELSGALNCEVVHCYGLTEGAGIVTMQPPGEHTGKAGSAGRAVAPFEPVRVCAVEDGADCAAGEVGEILVKGPCCTVGYVGDPEATAETIVGGWVRTGDLGRLDDDGDLWVTGRLKDQINRGGLKIGAREVEVVIEAVEGVQGVGVVAVPDALLGERVAAVVEAPAQRVTAEAIRAACAEVLADYKVPERIEIVAEMPRTSLGKPDKPAMRRLLADAPPSKQRSPA